MLRAGISLLELPQVIIMADKQTNKAYLKGKDKYHAQKKIVYTDRVFSGACHYCIADGDTNAGAAEGPQAGQVSYLPVESGTVGAWQ